MEKKDLWTRKTSVQLNINEDWVYNAIMFQFKYAHAKMKEPCASIEVSGLGIFQISKAKLRKQIEKYTRYRDKYLTKIENETDPVKLEFHQKRLENTLLVLNPLLEKQQHVENI